MSSFPRETCWRPWRQPISSATYRNAILFDLDGTLTDPKLGITRCIAHALRTLDVPVPDIEILTTWIGPPIQVQFREFLSDSDPSLTNDAVRIFRERFTDIGIYENEVYEGIPVALDCLRSGGAKLYLATGKPRPFAVRILEHFSLTESFSGIYGSEFDGSFADKGELICHLLDVEGLNASEVTMVGDRKYDVHAAAQNGIPCVGVLYGYGSREELLEAGAALLCERPHDLPEALAGVPTFSG